MLNRYNVICSFIHTGKNKLNKGRKNRGVVAILLVSVQALTD